MKVLFWNTCNKKIDTFIAALVKSNNVDLIVLAEYDSTINNFLFLVNQSEAIFEEIPQIGCSRITIFLKSKFVSYEHGPESSYFTSKKLVFSENFSMLLVCVHLPSKLHQTEQTQMLEAAEFKREIEEAEIELENQNTFIVGDFNMNPFEGGMISASAFHSIPCQKIADSKSRMIKDREHKFFYNPMWNLFGDHDNNPGSYYHRSSEQAVYFWNILDQVILRPELSSYFKKDSLEILKSIGGVSLVNKNGQPNLSDHLPIKFEFNLKEVLENEKFMA